MDNPETMFTIQKTTTGYPVTLRHEKKEAKIKKREREQVEPIKHIKVQVVDKTVEII